MVHVGEILEMVGKIASKFPTPTFLIRRLEFKLPSYEGTKGLGIAIDDRNNSVFHGCQTRVIHPEVKWLITKHVPVMYIGVFECESTL